jgi:hypothetical protein
MLCQRGTHRGLIRGAVRLAVEHHRTSKNPIGLEEW